jgi:hypothetical protein
LHVDLDEAGAFVDRGPDRGGGVFGRAARRAAMSDTSTLSELSVRKDAAGTKSDLSSANRP